MEQDIGVAQRDLKHIVHTEGAGVDLAEKFQCFPRPLRGERRKAHCPCRTRNAHAPRPLFAAGIRKAQAFRYDASSPGLVQFLAERDGSAGPRHEEDALIEADVMSDQARCGDVPQRLRRYQDDFAIGKAVRRIAGYARQPASPVRSAPETSMTGVSFSSAILALKSGNSNRWTS